MKRELTLGSLFDGSGGFPLGGILAGITPVWASEIEPFPIRVTTKRLPFMKHYGDISRMDGGQIEPVDIITFGSPCTDMSVAGKRAGLDGKQSSLFYQAVRIVKEMRCATNGVYPRYIVWENVPGAFSSNKGEDFRKVLEEICKIKDRTAFIPQSEKWGNAGIIMGGHYSLAWRVLDAQFWGVPQRRKRIYLVADFNDGSAGKILFESEGVSGYSAEGFRAWQGASGSPSACIRAAGNVCVESVCGRCKEYVFCSREQLALFENHPQDVRYRGPLEIAPTILSAYGTGGHNQPFVVETPKTLKIRSGREGGGKGALVQENKSATLSCNNDQTLFVPKAYGISSHNSNAMLSDNPYSGIYEAEISRTLDGCGGNPGCNQGGIAVVAVQGSMIGRDDRNGPQGSGIGEEVSFTLNATDIHAVAYEGNGEIPACCTKRASFFCIPVEEIENTLITSDYKDPPMVYDARTASGKEVFGTLMANSGSKQWLGNQEAFSGDYHVIEPEYIVRRLTPTECARLQGFPDWWCMDLGIEEPTEADLAYWRDVFETHRLIMGTSSKPKSLKQLIKWLKDPHSDLAEYKMWGNGVALPNVYFVLAGIVWAESEAEGANEKKF